MRHGNHNRKFGRETDQRRALLRGLCRSLIIRGKIKTTEAKAKEIRPMVEKLITKAKSATLANRRSLIATLGDEKTATKIIKSAVAYTDRAGGYTRIIKMGPRKGDAASMAVIEFV
ncbi:MAG TPA: 50S ribosomal protein L17 [Candidatus Paceibacterota bacterium]